MSNGPPPGIDPADLWTRITETPRPHKVIDFPRKDLDGKPMGRIELVVMSSLEVQACTAAADKATRRLLKEGGGEIADRTEAYSTLYSTRASLETLFRSCKRADDLTRPFFPSPDEIAKHVLPDEIAVIMREIMQLRSETGPIVAHMTDEEYSAWKEVLGKGMLLHPLSSLTWGATTELLLRLGADLVTLQTAKPSPGE